MGMIDMAQAVKRAEDARMLGYLADTAGLPYKLRVIQWDRGALEVRAGHVLLASVEVDYSGVRTMRHLSPEDFARGLGLLARQGWCALEPLPIPDNITLSDTQ